MSEVTRGLVIKNPWCDLILGGKKTWEIRGSRTTIRGRIAIIQSGTKHIHGYADLIDCIGPLSLAELQAHPYSHRLQTDDFWDNRSPDQHGWIQGVDYNMPYFNTYAWVLANPQRLKKPKPYVHPQGAIIWVNLENNGA